MRDVACQVIEQHVTANDDADGRPDDDVVEILRLHRQHVVGPQFRVGRKPLGISPGEQDADDVTDAVPMHRQRSDLDEDRVDVGKRRRGQRQRK